MGLYEGMGRRNGGFTLTRTSNVEPPNQRNIPSGKHLQFAIEIGPVKIADLPIKWIFPVRYISLPEGIAMDYCAYHFGNVIIATDFHSIIFQRGGSTTNQC